jgi:hypothetical protein
MGYKRFETDQRVIVSVADLLQDRLEILRINQATVLGLLHLMEVLQNSTVLFRLLELIIWTLLQGM